MTLAEPATETKARSGFAAFAAILAVSISGNAFVALSPLFVGAMADYWGMSEVDIGALISYEFLGTSITTILGVFFLHRPNWPLRRTAFSALSIFVLGNLVTPFIHEQHWALVSVRIICGLCAGLTWIVSATAIAHLNNNKRVLPLFYGSPFFTGMIFQPIMPILLQTWGPRGAYFLIAAIGALCFLLYGRYLDRNPPEATAADTTAPTKQPRPVPVTLVLASLTIQYVANTGLWTYFERIGVHSGHSAQSTATILSVALAFAIAGALLASAVAEHLRAVYAIVAGTVLISVASALVLGSESTVLFLVAASLFNLMITFVTPFYFIVLAQNFDPAKGAILGNIAMIVGFTVGPVLIGHTIVANTYTFAVIATLALFTVSIILVLCAFAALKASRDVHATSAISAT